MPQEQIIAYKTIFDSMMKGVSVKSFDEYSKSLQMSKSVIKKDNWRLSSCTCGEYMKAKARAAMFGKKALCRQ